MENEEEMLCWIEDVSGLRLFERSMVGLMVNLKEREQKRIEVEKTFHIPSCANYMHRKRNAVFFNTHNTFKHEMAKALGSFMLSKYGDVKFTDKVIVAINSLGEAADEAMKDFIKEEAEWITEAVPNDTSNRRVDLVKLDDGTKFEFECNHKVVKDKGDDSTITIYI